MRSRFSAASLALALATSTLHAANTLDLETALRRDLATPVDGPEAPQPGATLVGDPDSFGRNSHYLGLLYTGIVSMDRDCSSPDVPKGPDDRCVTLPADAAT